MKNYEFPIECSKKAINYYFPILVCSFFPLLDFGSNSSNHSINATVEDVELLLSCRLFDHPIVCSTSGIYGSIVR